MPGADHEPPKIALDAQLPESDSQNPFKNGGNLVKKEIGTEKRLDFSTNGNHTGHSEASQFPMPLGRSYSDFPGTKLTDSPPRQEVSPSKVADDSVKEKSVSKIF